MVGSGKNMPLFMLSSAEKPCMESVEATHSEAILKS